VITKVVFSAVIAVGVATGAAPPAGADPSLFGTLSCSCGEPVTVADTGADAINQTNLGIQRGLAYLQGIPPNG
jgi:hypothetical protein